MNKKIFFDLETTGLNYRENAIIQFGAIIVIDGIEVENINLRLRPFDGAIMTKEAMEINGISHGEVLSYPNQAEVYLELKQILSKYINKFDKDDKFIFIAQNLSFDMEFFMAWAKRNCDNFIGSYINWKKQFCTYRVSQALNSLGKLDMSGGCSLKSLCKHFGIVNEKEHDALADVKATMEVYYKLVELMK